MKLLSAVFSNFRLLRDLRIEFSTDQDRPLTVIRAANESGKTTILHGLQWALYGDAALPRKGNGFRLHPIDWDHADGSVVDISVVVEYEITTHRRSGGKLIPNRKRYRLVRFASERVDSNKRRSSSTVKLFQLTDNGANEIDSPDSQINDELPQDLREVFFTDGDRALSFIESDVAPSTKRKRVETAIRSLLGLAVIANAITHTKTSANELNKKVREIEPTSLLSNIASDIESYECKLQQSQQELDRLTHDLQKCNQNISKTEQEIYSVLEHGNKESLVEELKGVKTAKKLIDEKINNASKEHSSLFRHRSIAIDLLEVVLDAAFSKLEQLHNEGQFPSTTIPVLKGRLAAGICICGELLVHGDKDSDDRITHIQKMIAEHGTTDEIKKIQTDLYYSGATLLQHNVDEPDSWREQLSCITKKRNDLDEQRNEMGRRQRMLERKIAGIPNSDIKGLQNTLREHQQCRDQILQQQTALSTKIEDLSKSLAELKKDRDARLSEERRGAELLAALELSQDVSKVLSNAYQQITENELLKVSDEMNELFLDMIGASTEQRALIRRAEISRDFDIIVHGPNDRSLDPDRDLNGASRRALTLAFIMALTKVSGVVAPNVIDTPLGMASGYVKKSILNIAIRESKQLILFLTPDEISGCEEIISRSAGKIFTLTNPAHYPKMLVNEPPVLERKVLRCECDHLTSCELCERRDHEFN